jgi:hypothetical protein
VLEGIVGRDFLPRGDDNLCSGALMHGSNFVRSGEIGKIFKN